MQAFGALGRRMPSEHYPEYLTAMDDLPDRDCGAADADGTGADGTGAGEEGHEHEGHEGQGRTPAGLPPVTAGGGADLSSRPGKRKLSTDSSSRGEDGAPEVRTGLPEVRTGLQR